MDEVGLFRSLLWELLLMTDRRAKDEKIGK